MAMDADLDVKYISMEVADDTINLYAGILDNLSKQDCQLTYTEARTIAMSAVPEALRRLDEKRKEREKIRGTKY